MIISTWALYIYDFWKGWVRFDTLDARDYTQRQAVNMAKDHAVELKRTEELETLPKVQVVPDLSEV